MSLEAADHLTCPCCDLPQSELHKNIWISKPVCEHCVFVWYEGASVVGGAELVRRESRIKQGAAP